MKEAGSKPDNVVVYMVVIHLRAIHAQAYVAAFTSNAIFTYNINETTGEFYNNAVAASGFGTPIDVVFTQGRNLYASSSGGNDVYYVAVNPVTGVATGGAAMNTGLNTPYGMAITNPIKFLYVCSLNWNAVYLCTVCTCSFVRLFHPLVLSPLLPDHTHTHHCTTYRLTLAPRFAMQRSTPPQTRSRGVLLTVGLRVYRVPDL